jgi:hypothetical protein
VSNLESQGYSTHLRDFVARSIDALESERSHTTNELKSDSSFNRLFLSQLDPDNEDRVQQQLIEAKAAEMARVKAEAERAARIQAEAELARREAEAEAARLRAEADAAEKLRQETEMEFNRLKAEAEAARLLSEAEAASAARLQAEADHARLEAEASAARLKAEAEAAEVARIQAEIEAASVKCPPESVGWILSQGGIFNTWKKAYSVMENGVFSWYLDDKMKELRRSFNLKDVTITYHSDLPSLSSASVMITLRDTDQRSEEKSFVIKYEMKSERMNWLSSLKAHQEWANRSI